MSKVFNIKPLLWYFNILKFYVWYNNISDKANYIVGIRAESSRLDFLQYFVCYSELKKDYDIRCRIT